MPIARRAFAYCFEVLHHLTRLLAAVVTLLTLSGLIVLLLAPDEISGQGAGDLVLAWLATTGLLLLVSALAWLVSTSLRTDEPRDPQA